MKGVHHYQAYRNKKDHKGILGTTEWEENWKGTCKK